VIAKGKLRMSKIKNLYKACFKAKSSQTAARLITAWIIAAELFLIFTRAPFTSLDFFAGKSLLVFILLILIVFLALCAVRSEKPLSLIMMSAAFTYCLFAAAEYSDFYFLLGCSVVTAGFVHFSRLVIPRFSLSSKLLWVLSDTQNPKI